MWVKMGVARIHHALGKKMAPRPPSYIPASPFSEAIHDYYGHVDRRIGELLNYCGDDTAVLVVSDHGARPLMGGICINVWLQTEGYLTLQQQPSSPIPFEQADGKCKLTKTPGAEGYYPHIINNERGRAHED